MVALKNYKARSFGDGSGFWLRVRAEDAAPFLEAFRAAPDVFHEFQIEQRSGKGNTRFNIVRLDSEVFLQLVLVESGPDDSPPKSGE